MKELERGDRKISGAQFVQEAFASSNARLMFFGLTDDVKKGFELGNLIGLDRTGAVHVGTGAADSIASKGVKAQLFTLDRVSSKADVAARLQAAKRSASRQSKEVRDSMQHPHSD